MKSIETKYHGPTNFKGARFTATDGDNRVTVGYDHALNADENHKAAAMALKTKLAWKGSMQGGHTKTGMVFVFADKELVIK